MKINSFTANNVHDYLNFKLDFFSRVTFLIGINGSGKTSALKLILGLTTPSFNSLNQIKYAFCEVICSSTNNERDIIIRSKQLKDKFIISLTYKGVTIDSEAKRFVRIDDVPYDTDEIHMIEQRYKEEFDILEVPRKIRELITPKFLGLDRRIYEGSFYDSRYKTHRNYYYPSAKYKSKKIDNFAEPQAIDISLEEVQALVFDYTRRIPKQQYQINDEFKQRMFNQSFQFIEPYNTGQLPDAKSINDRKDKVLAAIEGLGIVGLTVTINNFFSKIGQIAKDFEIVNQTGLATKENTNKQNEIFSNWYRNEPQLRRIDSIIYYSQEYQKKLAELKFPFKKMENIISNFLKEGGKRLQIEPDGEIKVFLRNGQSTNIYGLSSGEKQIIIMIAHLIFEESQKESGIFIIDEPELSLHIAWQEIFVQSIMEASPKTQFIVATHSPTIISKVDWEKYCQDLNKFNF